MHLGTQSLKKRDYQGQGSSNPVLEGHCPAEFIYSPNHLNKLIIGGVPISEAASFEGCMRHCSTMKAVQFEGSFTCSLEYVLSFPANEGCKTWILLDLVNPRIHCAPSQYFFFFLEIAKLHFQMQLTQIFYVTNVKMKL